MRDNQKINIVKGGGGEQIYHKTKLLAVFIGLKILPIVQNLSISHKKCKFSIYLELDCSSDFIIYLDKIPKIMKYLGKMDKRL